MKVLGHIFNDRSSFFLAILYKFYTQSTVTLDILPWAWELLSVS